MHAKLPYMTDPLGKHWRQPKDLRDHVRLYETHATIPEWAWNQLPRYETSLPSGTYAGKAWRSGPYLCWYGKVSRDGKTIAVATSRALITGPGTNLTYGSFVVSDADRANETTTAKHN